MTLPRWSKLREPAGFPVTKTLVARVTFGLEHPEAHVGLPGDLGVDEGQGKPVPGSVRQALVSSHLLIALGHVADEDSKVRYFSELSSSSGSITALANNSVGKVIESVLRAGAVIVDEVGYAPLDDTGAQLLLSFAAAYDRRSLAMQPLAPQFIGAASCRTRPRSCRCSTDSCTITAWSALPTPSSSGGSALYWRTSPTPAAKPPRTCAG